MLTYDPEPVWNEPMHVPEKWIQSADENIDASESPSVTRFAAISFL